MLRAAAPAAPVTATTATATSAAAVTVTAARTTVVAGDASDIRAYSFEDGPVLRHADGSAPSGTGAAASLVGGDVPLVANDKRPGPTP